MKYNALCIAALAVAASASTASAISPGEKSIGPKLGWISHNESAVVGLAFRYTFSDHLRISPEIGCAFRHKGSDALLVDLNFHFPFGITGSNRAIIYPLAGITFNAWGNHGLKNDIDLTDDVTTHVNRFGINAGASFEFRCSSNILIGFEAKYSLIKSYSSAIFTASVGYVF